MASSKIWTQLVWAIDPFSKERHLQLSAALAAHALTRGASVQIEPVYLFDQTPLGPNFADSVSTVTKLQTMAQDSLNEIVHGHNLTKLLPVKILCKKYRNQSDYSTELIAYARSIGSDLIVASTHARKGIQRWFTGSFVENLMLYSDIPLFIVNPYWLNPLNSNDHPFEHILFPTDFSRESVVAFQQLLPLAQSLNCDVTLFYQIPYITHPHLQAGFSEYPFYEDLLKRDIEEKELEAKKLSEMAESSNVSTEIYIDYSLQGSPAEAILGYSKKKKCIIAMAARTGPISASLLGSNTRKVVRGAHYPVWVIHPETRKLSDSKEPAVA